MTGFFSATLRARSGKIAADGKAASLAVQRTNIASKGSASDSFSQYTSSMMINKKSFNDAMVNFHGLFQSIMVFAHLVTLPS